MAHKIQVRQWLPVVLLMLSSFVISACVAWGVFNAVPHLEDEHANLFQAKIFASGRFVIPQPEEVNSFFIPFIINWEGKQFSKYPPGYSLVLAMGVLLGQPWIVNSLAAAFTIMGVYLVGKELFDHTSGLLASTLAVISPMQVMLSGTLLSHTISICLLTFFTYTYLKIHSTSTSHQSWLSISAGVLLGLTFITRPWTAFSIGLPFAFLSLLRFMKNPRKTFRSYLLMVVAFLAVASIWLIYNQVATGNPLTNTYRMWWHYDTIGFGPENGRYGYTFEKMLANLRTDIPIFSRFVLGWPGNLFISGMRLIILMAVILPSRSLKEPALLVPVLSLISAYALYWAHSGGLYGVRYYAEAMPFLWLVAARGLLKAFRFKIARNFFYAAFPIILTWNIFFLLMPSFDKGRDLYNINRQDYQNIVEAGVQNAIVFVQAEYWTEYANLSWCNQPALDNGNIIFAINGERTANLNIIEAYSGRNIYFYDRDMIPSLLAIRTLK